MSDESCRNCRRVAVDEEPNPKLAAMREHAATAPRDEYGRFVNEPKETT